MLVLTEKLLGIIPGVYPHSCEDRWLLNKNSTGTQITCSNDYCPIKDSHNFKKALDCLELKVDIGEVRSLEIILAAGLESHMDIFKQAFEPFTEDNRDYLMRYNEKLMLIRDTIEAVNENGGFKLSAFMDAWGFEQLGTTRSEKLFSQECNIENFYDRYKTEEEMCEYIGKKLAISPYCTTVLAITHFLLSKKHDILEVAKYFKFRDTGVVRHFDEDSLEANLSVCITGEVTNICDESGLPIRFKPREKVVDYWTEKYGLPIEMNRSLTQTTKFLINDTGMKGDKVKKIKNKAGYRKCVMTSSDVFDLVLNVLLGDTSGVYSAQQQPQVKSF